MSEKEPVKHADEGQPSTVSMIAVDKLVPGRYQARISYPEEKLKQLADSIMKDGVIQPIIVCPVENGFEVCAGWGRVLASRMAGMKKIPALIRNLSDAEKAKLGVMENIQRQDLNVVETARGYEILQDTCKMTQEEIGRAVGRTRDAVAQTLRVLKFPKEVQNLLLEGTITPSHGEALTRLSSTPEQLMEAMGEVVSKKLTSTQTEQLVAGILMRTEFRKDMNKYINSEEFLVTLLYYLKFPIERTEFCPLCLSNEIEYSALKGLSKCRECGWNNDDTDTKLMDLTRRARFLLLKKKGIKNEFTQFWEGRKLP
ncbi:MAG: ParB/RepB/Spo0J family partition protein [Candidatus Bathyarchaeia archaeon]|jgi:ParB family chromosome partitioning protein